MSQKRKKQKYITLDKELNAWIENRTGFKIVDIIDLYRMETMLSSAFSAISTRVRHTSTKSVLYLTKLIEGELTERAALRFLYHGQKIQTHTNGRWRDASPPNLKNLYKFVIVGIRIRPSWTKNSTNGYAGKPELNINPWTGKPY